MFINEICRQVFLAILLLLLFLCVKTDRIMWLKRISILNYKNIEQVDLAFSRKMNCIIGRNGMGKTNLMDAVYYLSFCKSATNPIDSQNIRHGQEFFVIQGFYETDNEEPEEIYCGLKRRQKKQFKRNKKEYFRLSDHIGLLPLVMVSPADAQLIAGGSEERRRFMDVVISQFDREYLDALIRYNKALLQRNALLKAEAEPEDSLMEVWEEMMASAGETVFRKRCEFIEEFVPVFQSYYSIHKDDLIMRLGEYPMKREGSQGQNKTFLIALKLAQYEFLKRTGSRTTPLVLLDDIFDKLDASRVEQIVKLVAGDSFGQIFITDTNREHLDKILKKVKGDYKLFEVEDGVVTEREETDHEKE